MGAGSVMHGLDEETDVWRMGGLRRRMPITAITFVIGAASLAGLAPLSGFFSKDEVLLAVLDRRNPVFIALVLAGVVLSALYMARLVLVVFFGQPRASSDHAHESPALMTVPLMLLAFFAATVGFLAFGWTAAYQGFGAFLSNAGEVTGLQGLHFEWEIEVWLTVVSLLLAVAGVGIGWLAYSRGAISHARAAQQYPALYRLLVNKLYLDEMYQWMVDKVVLSLGRFVAIFDRVV